MRNIGSSIGISIVVSLLASNTQVSHAEIAAYVTPFNPMLHEPADQRSTGTPGRAAGPAALNARDHRSRRRSSPMPTTTG